MRRPNTQTYFLLGLIATALAVRFGAWAVFNLIWFGEGFQHPDSYLYHYVSLILREHWAVGDLVITNYPAYANLTALLYYLPGPDRIWPEFFNIGVSTATIYVGMVTLRLLGGSRAAVNITGVVLAFDPYLIYLSTQFLRDTLIVFGTALFLLGAVAANARYSVAGGLIVGVLRPLQLYALSPLVALSPAKAIWLIIPIMFVFIWPYIGPDFLQEIPTPPNAVPGNQTHVEFFSPHIDGPAIHHSTLSEWRYLLNPVFLIQATAAFLIFPYPWQADTLIEAAFGAYMVYWYVLLVIGGLGLLASPMSVHKKGYLIVALAVADGVFLAATTASQGPLVRWRIQLFYLMIPFLSAGAVAMASYETQKRAFDIVVSVAAVVLLAPIWASIGTILALTGRRIFFKQSRRGLGGEPFTVYKFVTMVPGSDGQVLTDKDPRVTRFGQLLRKTALDELPEVLAILSGRMSIVGPRALAIWEDDACAKNIPSWNIRYAVKPGLIGLAQLKSDRRDNADKLNWDKTYIQHRSFGFDLKLFLEGLISNVAGRWK